MLPKCEALLIYTRAAPAGRGATEWQHYPHWVGGSTLLLLRSTVFPELKGSPSLTRALLCTHIYKPIISLSQAPQERITEGG